MRSIFRVVFYLRSNSLNKEGKASVMIRFYLNNERASLGASGIFVDPEQWDSKNNRLKGRTAEALQVNLQLENIKEHITSLYKKVEFDEAISLDLIKNKYLGKKEDMSTLFDLFNAYIANQNKLVGLSITAASVRKYDVCKRHMQRFFQEEYKRNDLLIREITYAVISGFDLYIRSVLKQNSNTANKTMRTLKTIIIFGTRLGLFQIDPFLGYKPQASMPKRGYLTEEEIMKILKKQFAIERLSFVRDVFIFSCFTGLAYIDILQLKHGNLITFDGKKWIMTHRQKTHTESNILLLDIPQQLIQKYSPENPSEDSPIFPMLSNQKTNSYLKEIADLCGIKQNLTFHMARHTFATMSLSKGVPMESVSKMLGHTNIKTTQIYARITNKKIEQDMEQLASKLDKFNEAMGI